MTIKDNRNKEHSESPKPISKTHFYPLRFEPIFQYRLWGGRNLEKFMSVRLPSDGPYGEAWILSDREDFSSKVADGPLKGWTLSQLVKDFPAEMMGSLAKDYPRFPLLLKFLDCQQMLSVQVHPSDSQTELLPPGENGKSEAWVVLEAGPASLVYQGLNPGTTPENLRQMIMSKAIKSYLPSFTPKKGDAVYIPAGTVHTLGDGVMVFEVQENSDVTFRLYDWDRIDAKTGKPRELHIDKGIESINFDQGVDKPVVPVLDEDNIEGTNSEENSATHREILFDCNHFMVWRTLGEAHSTVGARDEPRILVCLEGNAVIQHYGLKYGIQKGEVMLIPAEVGPCVCLPSSPINILEIAIPRAQLKRD